MQTVDDKFWFQLDNELEVAESLFALVKDIQKRQNYKKMSDIRNFKLYANQKIDKKTSNNFNDKTSSDLVFNIVQAITDTIVSKIGKNKPRVTFLTDKGDWYQKKKAENLDMFVQGQFYKSKVYQTTPRILKRACVFGDGFGKIFPSGSMDNIELECKYTSTILVDDRETLFGDPNTLYEITYVSKLVLKSLYPESAKEIDEAQVATTDDIYLIDEVQTRTDMLLVVEGWRLPTRKGSKDGRHVLCISNKVMVDEDWDRNYFPFPHLKFSEKITGFWGSGIPELIEGIQDELNRTINQIQKSIKLAAIPRVFYEFNSKFVKETFTNEAGMFCGYAPGSQPPTIVTANAVNGDVFNYLSTLYQKAFEVIGVSQLTASSTKPAGLNSGKAIREYNDVETERFATLQACYDDLHLEIARQFIDNARIISKVNPKYTVITKTQGGTLKIKWKEVDMDDDSFIMQMYPTNFLPQHPAGRLESVIELSNSQLFTPQETRSLLDYPDIKAMVSLDNAKIDDIMLTMAKMIEDGDYIQPEIYQDLQYGIQTCQAFYLKYKHESIPFDRLELLTRWIEDASNLIKSMTAPPEPVQPELPTPPAEPLAEQPGMEGPSMSNMQLPNQTSVPSAAPQGV